MRLWLGVCVLGEGGACNKKIITLLYLAISVYTVFTQLEAVNCLVPVTIISTSKVLLWDSCKI